MSFSVTPQVAAFTSIAKFFDRHIKPPRGNWHFNLPGGTTIERHSEQEIIAEVKRWRQNNGTFVSDLDIERELWSYWCNREPARCASATQVPVVEKPIGPLQPAELTKELQGPPIWRFLNTLAVKWTPELSDYFLHTCDVIGVIMECPVCREEWRSLRVNRPPTRINSRLAACQWVNAVHNEVNFRLGKAAYPYSRMVTEYGAPPP